MEIFEFQLETLQQLADNPTLYSAESEIQSHLAKLVGLKSSSNLLLGDFGQRVKTLMDFVSLIS